MPTFPTLSSFKVTEEVIDSWNEGLVNDPTIRSDQEGGYQITRCRFTRDRRFWEYEYPYYTAADKATLMTFERTTVRVGSTSFTWTNPLDSVSYTVRFGEKGVEYKPNKGTPYWKIKIRVEEV